MCCSLDSCSFLVCFDVRVVEQSAGAVLADLRNCCRLPVLILIRRIRGILILIC